MSKKQGISKKAKYKIASVGLIIAVMLLMFLGLYFTILSSKPKTDSEKVAVAIKDLTASDEMILVRTRSKTSTGSMGALEFYEEGNGYIVNKKTGKFTLADFAKAGGLNSPDDINIIGKYNGYIYVHAVNEGITRVKDCKAEKIVEYANPSNIQIRSNKLLYVINNLKTKVNEVNLMNLDSGTNNVMYKAVGLDYVDAKLNDNGTVIAERLHSVEQYSSSGKFVGTILTDFRHIVSVDDNYVYFTIWGKSEMSRYNLKTETTDTITRDEYNSNLYNIKIGVEVDGARLLDLIGVDKNDDLYSLIFDDNDSVFFVSKDNSKIFSVDKISGVKYKVLDVSEKNEYITASYQL